MTSASIILASFARRTLSAASSRSSRSRPLLPNSSISLGRGVSSDAQGAQLLKRFLIAVEGPVGDLDHLLALLRDRCYRAAGSQTLRAPDGWD